METDVTTRGVGRRSLVDIAERHAAEHRGALLLASHSYSTKDVLHRRRQTAAEPVFT